MPSPNRRETEEAKTVNIRGRLWSYLEQRRVRRGEYYLLKTIGSPLRARYLVFDPCHGPGGEFFLLQSWPCGPAADRYLRVLRRPKTDSLPRAVDSQRRGDHIDVVLSWIDGISLEDYFENIRRGRRPPVAPREAVRLIRGLASAVCALHQKPQVAHGDIQPSNVIITDHPSRLILIDFGSAWTTDRTASREHGDGMNPFYAAPELQTKGATPVGFFADQFSVSVLFYELLTQELPYGRLGGKVGRPENISRARDALVPPSRISSVCRALPRPLRDGIDRLAIRGLAFDAEGRYPDRHAWLDDLFEVYARFRLPAELSPTRAILTRVIGWFVKPRGPQ